MPEGENLLNHATALHAGGASCTLELRGIQPALRAREQLTLRFLASDCGELPDELRLVADMPQMSHGPRETRLRRQGEFYAGEMLFVMGGRWELRLFAGEQELLRGWVEVAER